MSLVGDDWAEDHHDVEVVDDDGRVPRRPRRERAGISGQHRRFVEESA